VVDTGFTHSMVRWQTEKALLFRSASQQVWLPKSQVTWKASQSAGEETAHIPNWLHEKADYQPYDRDDDMGNPWEWDDEDSFHHAIFSDHT